MYVPVMSANVRKGTGVAKGIFRAANIAAEMHYSVAKVALVFARYKLFHSFFSFQRILLSLGIKAQSSADADAMGVSNDAAKAENVAQKQIGNLSANSGQGEKLLHSSGYLSVIFINNDLRCFLYAFSFAAIKSTGFYKLLYF